MTKLIYEKQEIIRTVHYIYLIHLIKQYIKSISINMRHVL